MIFTLLAVLLAAAPAAPSIPDTPAGRHARAWLDAYSRDEAAMRRFHETHWTAEALTRRPVAERLEQWRQMHDELGALTLARADADGPDRVMLGLVAEHGAEVEVSFESEPGGERRLVRSGVQVEQGGGPGAAAGPPPGGPGVRRAMSQPPAGLPITVAAMRDSIDRALDELTRADRFSGVVQIVRGDDTLYARATGWADRRNGVPNRIDTRFNLGSIDKLFTQIAIAQLEERGLLSRSDTLSKHLSDLPASVASRITIDQILHHRSGLGDFFGPEFERADKGQYRTLRNYLPLFKDHPLEFEPGTRSRYSNAGYIVLGLVIEKLTGMSYHDYVRERIFRPAGMDDTGALESDVPEPRVAMGYTRRAGEGLRENIYTRPARGTSAGGGYSTARDLVRLAAALKAGKLLSPEAARRTVGEAGMFAGGAPGINGAVGMDLERGETLVVLANLDPPSAEGLAERIRGWLRRARA